MTKRRLDEVVVLSDDECERDMQFIRQYFSMLYINAMPSAEKNIQDYIFLWLAIIINNIFHDLSDISRD